MNGEIDALLQKSGLARALSRIKKSSTARATDALNNNILLLPDIRTRHFVLAESILAKGNQPLASTETVAGSSARVEGDVRNFDTAINNITRKYYLT